MDSDAWDIFLRSRFNAPVGVELLDIELDVLQKQLSSARRQRNARAKACGLPAEVLTSIFMCAQEVWKPSKPRRSSAVDDGRTSYGAGWMAVTRVCSSWRNVCILTLSGWRMLTALGRYENTLFVVRH